MADRKEQLKWEIDKRSAEAYERFLVPALFSQATDRLIEGVGLRPGERVLDVGCGTGIVARRAATRVGISGRLVGLDASAGMLAAAQAVSAGSQPEVTWLQGEAATLPFDDGAFNVVFCQQALQFFPDAGAALKEMHRVLAPQGRLALSVWRSFAHNPTYPIAAEVLQRHVGDEAATLMRLPFASWDREQLRALVQCAGFAKVYVTIGITSVRFPSVQEMLRRQAASSPLDGPLGALTDDAREALHRDLDEALQAYVDDGGVAFPMEAHVVFARR